MKDVVPSTPPCPLLLLKEIQERKVRNYENKILCQGNAWLGPRGVIGSCQPERLYLIRAPKSII